MAELNQSGLRRARGLRIAAWIAFAVVFGLVAYVRVRYFADVVRLSPNYPKANPRPVHVVELRVSIPTTLKVQLFADYRTFNKECWHWTNFPLDYTDLSLSQPVELKGTRQQKTALVTVDRYLPGRCNWYFSGIRYFLPEGVEVPYPELHGRVAVSREAESHAHPVGWQPLPGQLPQGRVDLWCSRHLFGLPAPYPLECTTWAMAIGPSSEKIAPSVRNAPDSDKGDVTVTFVLASTRAVEIHFHDLDAMN